MSHTNPLFAGFRVRENGLWLSDTTVGDVTTGRHGFCPKLPNDATKFLNGASGFTTPPGSGTGYAPDSPDAWLNQGSATIAYANDCGVITAPTNSGDSYRAIVQTLPGGNWEFRAKISVTQPDSYGQNYGSGGLILRRSASGTIESLNVGFSGGWQLELQKYTNTTTFNTTHVNYTNSVWPTLWIYFKLAYDGTNVTYAYSLSGLTNSFTPIAIRSASTDLGGAADQIGVFANTNNASYTWKTFCSWFRRIS